MNKLNLTIDLTEKHFYNAHFPGLYSIVIHKDRVSGLRTRLFAAKPGKLHSDLRNPDGRFLWHAHGYDFEETSLLGAVNNIIIEPCYPGDHSNVRVFHTYAIGGGSIGEGIVPRIKRCGLAYMRCLSHKQYEPGEGFRMRADKIHRVVFGPCKETGWFACLVEEKAHANRPGCVYSEYLLDKIPNAKELYVKIDNDEAQWIVDNVVGLVYR